MNTDMINEKQSMTVNSQFKISVEDRLRLLKSLKDEINLNEEHIYEALDLDLKKPRFETYATSTPSSNHSTITSIFSEV